MTKTERAQREQEISERSLRESLMESFLAAGGTKSEFEASYPKLRQKHLENIALGQASAAQSEMFRNYRSKF